MVVLQISKGKDGLRHRVEIEADYFPLTKKGNQVLLI